MSVVLCHDKGHSYRRGYRTVQLQVATGTGNSEVEAIEERSCVAVQNYVVKFMALKKCTVSLIDDGSCQV